MRSIPSGKGRITATKHGTSISRGERLEGMLCSCRSGAPMLVDACSNGGA